MVVPALSVAVHLTVRVPTVAVVMASHEAEASPEPPVSAAPGVALADAPSSRVAGTLGARVGATRSMRTVVAGEVARFPALSVHVAVTDPVVVTTRLVVQRVGSTPEPTSDHSHVRVTGDEFQPSAFGAGTRVGAAASTGAEMSCGAAATRTRKVPVTSCPRASSARHDTSVSPTGKSEPDAGVQVTVGAAGSLSDAVAS